MVLKWIGLLIVLITATTQAEFRTWTAQNGDDFVGKLVSENKGKVVLKGRSGKIISVPIRGLSQKDQDYIVFNRPINLQIDIGNLRCSTNRNLHCPHVQIRKKGQQEINKQLDLYVLVFEENGKLNTHTRELDIRFFSSDDTVELLLESANFSKRYYGSTLVMVVDSEQNIVASKTTNKKSADPVYQKILLKSVMWSYTQHELTTAESPTDPTRGFSGKLYDLTRRRGGAHTITEREAYDQALTSYAENKFDETALARYYRSTNTVSFSNFSIPPSSEVLIADLFLDKKLSLQRYSKRHPWQYALQFTRTVNPERDVSFRLVGQTDGLLIVGIEDQIVLSTDAKIGGFQSEKTPKINPAATLQNLAFKSEWITLKKGTETTITVLLGPNPKSMLSALLFAEEKDVEYPRNEQGDPILPLFASDKPPQQIIDLIYADACPMDTKPPDPFILKGMIDEPPPDDVDTDQE